jgi:hypothetical protein
MDYHSNSNSNAGGAFETKIYGDPVEKSNYQSAYTQWYRMSESSFGALKNNLLPLRFGRRRKIGGTQYPDHFRIKRRSFTNGKYYLYCDEDSSDYDESDYEDDGNNDNDDKLAIEDGEIIFKVHVNGGGNVNEEVVRRQIDRRTKLKRKRNALQHAPTRIIDTRGLFGTNLKTADSDADADNDQQDDLVSLEEETPVVLIVDEANVVVLQTQVSNTSFITSPLHSPSDTTPAATTTTTQSRTSRTSSRLQAKEAVDYTKFFGRKMSRGMKKNDKNKRSPSDN